MSKNFPLRLHHDLSLPYDMGMKKSDKKEETARRAQKTKSHQPIPLPIIQNEQEDIDQEMEELFDEDKVTHQHGSTHPEAD